MQSVNVPPTSIQNSQGFMRLRDRWEDVGRSIKQLILGTYMVWDARRLRLCERYFEAHDPGDLADGAPTGACPYRAQTLSRDHSIPESIQAPGRFPT